MAKAIPETALKRLNEILERLELSLNVEKTKLVTATEESFDFLGFTVRYDRSKFSEGSYWNIFPSKKSCLKNRANLKSFLRRHLYCSPATIVKGLNPKIRGWINYFWIPGVSYSLKAQRDLRYYLCDRLRRYYRRKSQRRSKLYRRKAFDVLVRKYGLVDPSKQVPQPGPCECF